MNLKPVLACVAGLAGLGATLPPAEPPVMMAAENCLRGNVARVAALDKDLTSAADFLLEDLCAQEVEAASRYARNTDLIAVLAANAPAAATRISVDPVTGRLQAPVEPGKSPTDGIGAINVLQAGFTPAVAPSLRTLAARLVLEARAEAEEARTKRRPVR